MGSWLNLVFVIVLVLKSKALSIVVVQNNGKEMYKKVRCKCKFVMFSLGFEKLSLCVKVKSGRIKVG